MAHLKAIVAVDKNWGIGKNNGLLFYIPEDINFFKCKTSYNYIAMGRKTFESIGRLLPNRHNIIITNQIQSDVMQNQEDDCIYCTGAYFDNLINNLPEYATIYIIGGESIYNKYYDKCEKIYATIYDKKFEADRHFPNLYESDFKLREVIKNGYHDGHEYQITLWTK